MAHTTTHAAWIAAWMLAVGWCGCSASASAAEEAANYEGEVRPLLTKYCFSCHGPAAAEANLSLASFREPDIFNRPAVWRLVRRRLASGEMPPPGEARPAAEERARLLAFCDAVLARHTIDGKPDPGPLVPRRLNVREHMNMLRDLTAEDDRPRPRRTSYQPKPDGTIPLPETPEHPTAFVSGILPPDTQDGGFDTIGDNLTIPPFLLERYFRTNKRLFDELLAFNARKSESYQAPLYRSLKRLEKGMLPRGQTQAAATAEFVAQFASRAFRRPVTAGELEKYLALCEQSQAKGESFEASLRLPLEAILISPRFVVLWSDAASPPVAAVSSLRVRPLDDHELAARLALFLWSGLPDRELAQLARDGKLSDPDVLRQQAARMLGDSRVAEGLRAGFVAQWLQLDRLDRSNPDSEIYPEYFQQNLSELMQREVLLFADAILVEDRSIVELLDADWGFLCYPLAQNYGLADFPGKKPSSNADPAWYRVKFPDKRRGGVLTMGKVLTGTSHPRRTSPVHRGKWLLETVLGAPPPPPPPNVNNVLPDEPAKEGERPLTTPQLLARHRENVACNACHKKMDPLGIALEHFDPVGRWREVDQQQPVDARGVLSDGAAINGIAELKALLVARKDDFARSFVEQMLSYALGRKLEFYDDLEVERIVRAVAADDYKFSRVVIEIAASYPFRHCRAAAAAEKEP